MAYLKAFLIGGALCLMGQILIDKTKLTPARILVSYVVLGVVLGATGIYPRLADFAGAGATVLEIPWPKGSGKPLIRTDSSAFSPEV